MHGATVRRGAHAAQQVVRRLEQQWKGMSVWAPVQQWDVGAVPAWSGSLCLIHVAYATFGPHWCGVALWGLEVGQPCF